MLNGKHRQPVQGPLCAQFAPVLPLLDDLTDAHLAAKTRAHLAGCAWCRAQRATYDRFDEALRRHFAPDVMPYLPIDTRAFMEPAMPEIQEIDGTSQIAAPADKGAQDGDAPELTISPLPIPPHAPHSPHSSRRSWRLATGMAGLAAVLALSLLAGLLFASHGRQPSTGDKHATATASVPPDAGKMLIAVSMSSSTDGWAIGRGDGGSSDVPAYVLHYTGNRWVPVQTPIKAGINAIKMLSPTDGWAIGARVYHYDGVAWREIHMPVSTEFQAISVISPNNIWIAGGPSPVNPPDGRAVILHYDGSGWFPQKTPSALDYTSVYSLSMVSATDGWAVGTAQANSSDSNGNPTQAGVILRYHNGAWEKAQTLPGADLRTVSMSSASDGWIGGTVTALSTGYPSMQNGKPQQITVNVPRLLHYANGQWVEVSAPHAAEQPGNSPQLGEIVSVSAFSATQVWVMIAINSQRVGPDNAPYVSPRLFRLDHGRWMEQETPLIQGRRYAFITQVAFVSADEFWGVGNTISSSGTPIATGGYIASVTPLIVHYKSGSWTVVES